MHSLFSYDSDASKFIEPYKLYSWTRARQLVTFTESYRVVVFVNSVCLTCNRRQEENRKGKAARPCGNKQQWTSILGRTTRTCISGDWIVLHGNVGSPFLAKCNFHPDRLQKINYASTLQWIISGRITMHNFCMPSVKSDASSWNKKFIYAFLCLPPF